MSVPSANEEATIAARRILLDALAGLGAHRASVVLVGAQAVYLRTPGVALPFSASYTTDADLAVDPGLLADTPDLDPVMRSAGFDLVQPDRPGIWGKEIQIRGQHEMVTVDLIVPEALAGKGSRAARLVGHSRTAVGRARGLEAAVVDRSPIQIGSFDGTDQRSYTIHVAGPTALLVAKLHKLAERIEQDDRRPDRVKPKDAADTYRLMLHTDPDEVLNVLRALLTHPVAGEVTSEALRYLDSLYRRPRDRGTTLAEQGLAGDVPPQRVRTVCTTFTHTILTQLST